MYGNNTQGAFDIHAYVAQHIYITRLRLHFASAAVFDSLTLACRAAFPWTSVKELFLVRPFSCGSNSPIANIVNNNLIYYTTRCRYNSDRWLHNGINAVLRNRNKAVGWMRKESFVDRDRERRWLTHHIMPLIQRKVLKFWMGIQRYCENKITELLWDYYKSIQFSLVNIICFYKNKELDYWRCTRQNLKVFNDWQKS